MMLTKKNRKRSHMKRQQRISKKFRNLQRNIRWSTQKRFLKRLGNPAADRKIVHVAGTNGKGSVCAYLQAILMAEGREQGSLHPLILYL